MHCGVTVVVVTFAVFVGVALVVFAVLVGVTLVVFAVLVGVALVVVAVLVGGAAANEYPMVACGHDEYVQQVRGNNGFAPGIQGR